MEESKGPRKREFKKVDEEEEPCAGADKVFFWEGEGEEVDGHDGTGRIGDHGGDSGPESHGPREEFGVGDGGGEVGQCGAGGLKEDGGEEHPAQDGPEVGFGEVFHHPEAQEDSGDGGWEHSGDLVPEGVGPKGLNGAEISDDEQREENAGAFHRGKGMGHQGYSDHADAREAAFGEAHAEGGGEAEKPEHGSGESQRKLAENPGGTKDDSSW